MRLAEHRRLRPGFELQVAADGAAAEQAALLLLAELRRLQRPLGLATGRTMEPVYAALVARLDGLPAAERHGLLAGWQSFNLDEYVGLGPRHPGSFAAFMGRHLVEPLGLDPARVRLPDGLAADPALEARRYAARVAAAGGIGLQLLGLGLNGHVGFNEPPCGPDAPCRCLELSAATRRQNATAFGGDPAAVPARAITLGLAEILAAERILLVVTGAAKAPVLARLLQEPPSPELPASWLQRHPAVTLVVDQAALGEGAPG
ncbi:MAG: glucosamine-6-phosphate deaminase [Cyanobacteriota bacterium]|nr:glucosamine-6-phosphate deaminase [Cyanobacteriota bacterium]